MIEGGWQLCCGRRVVSKRSSAGVCRWTRCKQGMYVWRIVRPSLKPSNLYIYALRLGTRLARR